MLQTFAQCLSILSPDFHLIFKGGDILNKLFEPGPQSLIGILKGSNSALSVSDNTSSVGLSGKNNPTLNSDAADYYNNNSFIEYLEGLMASQGQEAVENRLFNSEEAAKARAFAAAEAQKNRDWQDTMSSTAWQRTVADLQKAGLNPILAYAQGSASTPTGSSAQSSQASINSTGGDTLSSVLNAFANLISSAGDIASVLLKIPTGKAAVKGFR